MAALRLDLVSIFPGFFDVLDLSLAGKARAGGLLDVRVHDLRAWTHDRHHTVDDTPYGGGAGMVMKPEPWGEALDALLPDPGPAPGRSVLVVPTPSGTPFTQAQAAELATADHLVLACGRYEGIDQRVVDHARTRVEVREVSLGDYVLNGGEVAALAVVEAVVRLLPGFMGNPASLAEESHTSGLLEYPVYTKPASWRGLDVPPVLLSGDHARIATWRHEQAVRRTAERRPDLLHASQGVGDGPGGLPDVEWRPATRGDVGEILTLQKACWVDEAIANDLLDIPALVETYDDVAAALLEHRTMVLRSAGRLVGSVRGSVAEDGSWFVGRLMAAPDLRGRGIGRWLLEQVEAMAPAEVTACSLVTGARNEANIRFYRRAGYRPDRVQDDPVVLRMRKPRR